VSYTPAIVDRGTPLADKAAAITEDVIVTDYARRPELMNRYGERGRAYYRRDNLYHISFLVEAIRSGEPALFTDYIGWAKPMLATRGVACGELVENLRLLRESIQRHLSPDDAAAAAVPIDASLELLPTIPAEPPTFCTPDAPNSGLTHDYLAALLRGDRKGAAQLIHRAARDGLSLKRIYLDVFQKSQREIGRLWQINRVTVGQEHYCTAATQAIMNHFLSQILESPRIGRKIIAFCVGGDLHEIGLRIVADFFELSGWDCDFLGANTPAESLLDSLAATPPDLIAASATMTYHVELIRHFIGALRARRDIPYIPVLVGGRPFLVAENLWQRIGADGWAPDAESAVATGAALVQGR
jgi:methanogenic corrinoid protein MtbC1